MIVLVIDDAGDELEANNTQYNRQLQVQFTKMFMGVAHMH